MARGLLCRATNRVNLRGQSEIRRPVRKPTSRRPQSYLPSPSSNELLPATYPGESLSEIARKEGRHRATVTKIVRSEEVAAIRSGVESEALWLLGCSVIGSLSPGFAPMIMNSLISSWKDFGVVPSETERIAAQVPETTGSTSDGVKRQLEKAVEIMMERKQIYGTPLEEIEEMIGEKLLPLERLAGVSANEKMRSLILLVLDQPGLNRSALEFSP